MYLFKDMYEFFLDLIIQFFKLNFTISMQTPIQILRFLLFKIKLELYQDAKKTLDLWSFYDRKLDIILVFKIINIYIWDESGNDFFMSWSIKK